MSGKNWFLLLAVFAGCNAPPHNPSPSRLFIFGSFYNTRASQAGKVLVIEDVSLDLIEFEATGKRRTVHPFCRDFDVYGDVVWVLPGDQGSLLRIGLSGGSVDTFEIPWGFSFVGALDSSGCILVNEADSFFLFEEGNPSPGFLFRHYWDDPIDHSDTTRDFICKGSEIFLDNGEVLDTSGNLLESWPLGHDFLPWGEDVLFFLSDQGNIGRVNRSTGKVTYFPSRVSGRSEARSIALPPDGEKAYFCATDETWEDSGWGNWIYCLYEYEF